MKVLAFTPSRANTPQRAKLLLQTITQARETAGHDFHWHLYCQRGTLAQSIGTGARVAGLLEDVHLHDDNVGQHPPFNESLALAMAGDYDFLLRLDDDCEFLSKRWLAKLIDISAAFEHTAILTPAVKGLKFPPPRGLEQEIGDYKVEFLLEAIGGICRLHPISVLTREDDPYVSDVRLPLGSGDASGIGVWCQRNIIPMIWAKNVRVRHTTKEQEEADEEHFVVHNLFQRLPYIPPMESL